MKGSKWNGLSSVLVLAGALNWGLIGVFRFNLVSAIFGPVAWIVYIAVGWAAVYKIVRANGKNGSD